MRADSLDWPGDTTSVVPRNSISETTDRQGHYPNDGLYTRSAG
ncbi:MAG: hypothetical protein OXC29_19075 [Rhodococcus sp.]|nr:hypothetical protein [Rhodococcus sp. (in: high G+C Gram-positive bacteria)]